MAALPRFVVLKSNHNNKYLRYEDVKVKEFLQFTEEEVVSPYAKFEVVMAKSGNGLVHIRCCYNNKYLVRQKPGSYWIPATAIEPEEDRSKWSCTLFKPVYIDGDTKTVRFWHVQLAHYVKLFTAGPFTSCLYAESEVPEKKLCDFTIIDWESLKSRELPRYVVLKSNYNNKYLRYIQEQDVKVHGFLQFSEEEVVSPYAKFEVVMAESGNGLVHLRCCYNYKYWVRQSQNHWWIVAAAKKPEEDQSKWSCTLFKPVYVDGDAKTVRFLHVQLEQYACLWRAAAPFTSCLLAGSKDPNQELCDVCTIIDWESLKKRELPKFVVLKSNYNNKYLRYIQEDVEVHGLLQFSEEEVLSPYVKFEVVMAKSGNGLVHLRCCYNYKYWVRRSQTQWWIVAAADEREEDQSKWSCTLFKPVYIGGDAKIVRFLHVQLGQYACLWRAAAPFTSCLLAGSENPDQDLCDVCKIIDWESLERRELPRFVVLKSNYNNKYLRYIQEDVKVHGLLQFSGEEFVSPYAKFEVVMAKSGNGLVHLRCCYNNKYWVRWKHENYWIAVAADEREEDQTKWSCTLFKPIYVDGGDAKTVRFLHVQLQHYACLWRVAPPYDSCLCAASEDPNQDLCDVCTVIDWESLLTMPKHVAFKGDNGNYLSARWIKGHQYLHFASTDIGDPTVGNEVFTTHDGSICIKSDYFGKFWRRGPNWIWADTDDTTNNNPDTLFCPIKVDNNVVALRNLGNNNFSKRLTTEGKISCLNAAVSTISREARIEVEELVISRQIYNVDFHLMDARTYNKKVLTMATEVAINRTQEPDNAEVKLSYTKTKSSTWNASVSLKLGVKTRIQTGIPLITEGKIEISNEFTGAYEWGETKESTTQVETVYKVTVPPMTMVTVSLLATMGSCDIPFSYSQRDTLNNGQQITYNMEDGIYSGVNSFNFKYETKQEKL